MSDDDMGILRESDPLKWAVLQGCEFAESVPPGISSPAFVAEMWLHIRRMAKFIRRETEKARVTT